MSTHQFRFLVVIVLCITGGLLKYGYEAIERQAYSELDDESTNILNLFASNLEGVLAKYEYLPELLSRNAYLINALRSRNAAQIQETNRYLQSVALSSGASDVYLMDQEGLTIAASNFDLDR